MPNPGILYMTRENVIQYTVLYMTRENAIHCIGHGKMLYTVYDKEKWYTVYGTVYDKGKFYKLYTTRTNVIYFI